MKKKTTTKTKKKVSAQSAAYIKGYKLEKLDNDAILSNAKIKFDEKKKKWINPETGRALKDKSSAVEKAAKLLGWKNLDEYKAERQTRAYKQFEKRAKSLGKDVQLGSEFSEAFRKWKESGYTKRSEEMRGLLTQTKWIDLGNYTRYSKTKPVAYTVTGYTPTGKPKTKKGKLKGVI